MERINVTKSFLPPLEEYEVYLKGIWERDFLTNQGPLLQKLEQNLKDRLHVKNLHFMTNGTLALQVAIRSLGITEGEIITTPFSYVATASSILWEHCTPVFVDIEPLTFCIDANKIEAAITPLTKAIMPVHVFGNPCDVEKIDVIAKKHALKVIYDAAHAFGVEYRGKSLLDYGDISMCSFHATKVFHTIEGGCLVVREKAVSEKVELTKRFGHTGDNHIMLGTNAKANEFQAAMGLAVLPHMDEILAGRKLVCDTYDELIDTSFRPTLQAKEVLPNYAYYPVVLKNETHLLTVMDTLAKENIFPRRYFYPSLNTLPYLITSDACPISEDIASRILCLPLYVGLSKAVIQKICEVINA